MLRRAPAVTSTTASHGTSSQAGRLGRNAWWLYLVVAAAGTACYFAAPGLRASGPLFNALGLSAAAALVIGPRLHRPSRRLPWYLLAFAQVFFVTGDVLYYLPGLLHYQVDFPSAGDIFYVGVYPLIVVGLLILVRARTRDPDHSALIDALIVLIGVGVVSWVFLMLPYARNENLALTDKVLSIAYPLMDVLVLSVTARLAVSAGRRPPALRLLVTGLIALVTADSVYGYIELHGTYRTGSWLDIGWIAYYCTWGAAALHPSMRDLSETVPDPGPRLSGRRLAVLTVASLLSPVVLSTRLRRDQLLDEGVLVAGTVLLFLFVVIRLRLAVRQHEDAQRRERILRGAGAMMGSAHTRGATCAAAIAAVRDLVADATAVVAVGEGDPGELTLYGPEFTLAGTGSRSMPLRSIPREVRDELREGRSVWLPASSLGVTRPLDLPPDGRLTLLPLMVQDSVTGVLAVASGRPPPLRTRDSLEALASQIALALEAANIRQHRSEARFRSLVQNSSDIVTVLAPDGTIRYQSPAIEHVLGYDAADLAGTNMLDMVHPDDRDALAALLAQVAAGRPLSPPRVEARCRERSGGWRYVETLWTDLSADPNVEGVVLNTRDISERKALQERLAHHAFHDPATGLANQLLFRDRLEHALARQARDGSSLTVFFMDLDDFKTINDGLGHTTADRILVEVGRRVRESVRAGDTVARFGGDEFAVLLESVGRAEAPRIAETVLAALGAPFLSDGREVFVRASVGIAVSDAGAAAPANGDHLLRDADLAMYVAKESGKGRYEMFQPAMHARVVRRLELRADLQRALGDGEFRVFYQPVVELDSGRLAGVEALVRWQHPQLQLVSPADFIPIAEETGLVLDIGRWVLQEACALIAALARAFPELSLTVAVNLSARQLQSHDLVGEVVAALAAASVDPRTLTVEITESMMMHDPASSARRLRDLKSLGVQVAVDDFGTGYSSLNYLRQFPLDILKVDRSFVERLDRSRDDRAIAEAIIRLAQVLGLRTVAEGIETGEQLEQLVALDCHYGQGYHLARPMDGTVLVGFVERWQQRGLPVDEKVLELIPGARGGGAGRARSARAAIQRLRR